METLTQLTDTQSALLPSADDIQFYADHGYWISPVIIPDEVLDRADHGMSRYYAGDLDGTGMHPSDYLW